MDDVKPGKPSKPPLILPPAQRRASRAGGGPRGGQGGADLDNAQLPSTLDLRQTTLDIADAAGLPPHPRPPKKSKKGMWVAIIVAAILLLLGGSALGAKLWYDAALQPVASDKDSERVRVTIKQGTASADIAKSLKSEGLIQSELAFRILLKRTGKLATLQAGQYLLSPSQSSQHILDVIAGGEVDTFNITITPGLTLAELRQRLVKDGFAEAEIDEAFAAQYDHALFADKPANTTLEGYIFPDTYQVTSQTTVRQLLVRTFDHFEEQIQQQDIRAKLAQHGLSLYQGITVASIVQKEVSDSAVQPQVAQVFYKRLASDIELGSDVTYMYAAKQMGVPESVDLDSPYNTRLHKGLPPGPIANYNLSALLAVAAPAAGEYLYFVAGDDGETYFSDTLEQHNAAVQAHCTKLCN